MDRVNFDLMRTRIEFTFRLIGKIFGRTDFPVEVIKRIVTIISTEGVNLSFTHRWDDKISFEASERKIQSEFAEIVIRHFNNIRKRMNDLPPNTIAITVANIEILIRDGMETMMIELKMFFEKLEKKTTTFQVGQEVDFEISHSGKSEIVRATIEESNICSNTYTVKTFNEQIYKDVDASKLEAIKEVTNAD